MGLAVAGFHRSGTSSVMQHLIQSGLHPGDDLIGSNDYNPYGHFEDWAPVRIHNTALEAAGLDWASVEPRTIPLSNSIKSSIRNYCEKRAAQRSEWGFKDPRACQFLDHWMEAHPSLKLLIIYRSPVECSWSIYRRAIRASVRGEQDKTANRIRTQPDHALALWVTHNRKLIDTQRQFPTRTMVISHNAFADGFNIAAALHRDLSMRLTPAEVKETFREDIVTRHVSPLPVSNEALRTEASAVWKDLQSLDFGASSRRNAADPQFLDDPTGLILANQLMAIEVTETRKFVGHDSKDYDEIVEKLQAANMIARKLRRWPFSTYFLRSKKYSQLIDKVLS